jgi:hypothetical protein
VGHEWLKRWLQSCTLHGWVVQVLGWEWGVCVGNCVRTFPRPRSPYHLSSLHAQSSSWPALSPDSHSSWSLHLLAVLAGGSKVNIGYPTCPRHNCGVPSLGLRISFLRGKEACYKSKAWWKGVQRQSGDVCSWCWRKLAWSEAVNWRHTGVAEQNARSGKSLTSDPQTSGLFYFILDKTFTQTTEPQQSTQCLHEGIPTCQISNAGSQVESRSRSEMLSTKFPRTLEEPHEAMFSSQLADH